MKKKKENRKAYTFTITPSIKQALEEAADKDRRSMSSFLEKLILDHCEKEGIEVVEI